MKREDYDFSKEERIEIIYFLLLLLSYGCKADAICCFLNISRNTLKSDMKFVRKKLAEKNLQICSRTKRGLIIQGREILIRKLLLEEYKKILMPKMTKLLMEGLIPILLTWAIIPAKGNIFRALVSSIYYYVIDAFHSFFFSLVIDSSCWGSWISYSRWNWKYFFS
ncbi:helix-turn-helix domain-containing protein [Fusobacterium necrophorum]|uniref:helix-turn-helix domain-containing protein n=1 Tax=Fusobacterium necrophorum TaxID=859 RepID=UPI0021C34BDC|nr:helix-turn-helix domain-containing protein [Fusobacterium necrophorum]